MKFAFTLFRYFPYGGLQRDFASFLKEGLRRGHSITVLYDRWEGDFIPGAEYEQLKCRGMSNWGRAREFEALAGDYFKTHSFDKVIGFNRMAGLDYYYAADIPFAGHARKRAPLIRLFLPRYRVFERMECAVFGTSGRTVILYLTERQKAEYQQFYGTGEARFRYLPPEVSPDFLLRDAAEAEALRRRLRAEFGIPEKAFFLIQVCSSFRTKGVDRVLEALAKLSSGLRSNVFYLVAGKDDPGEYLKQAERLGLSGQVIFTGPRHDVPELLTAADLMVHPARNEAAGAVLAEAAVCGLPAICSEACGYAPLVKDAGGVVLEEPFAVSALVDALELSLRLPDALDRMRKDAREYAGRIDFRHRTECFWDFIEEKDHA